jgi:hypothetical protein
MDLPIRSSTSFAQGFQEQFSIFVTAENVFPTISAVDQMVNRAFIFDAGMPFRLVESRRHVNIHL